MDALPSPSTETPSTTAHAGNGYQAFQRRKRRLAETAGRLRDALEELDMTHRTETVTRLRERIESDRFKVMVLGEFKRGKSTVINALLGETVLPVRVIPCTAVINEVKWGRERRAVLHFRHPLPEPLPADLPADVVAHLDAAGGAQAPPLEVAVDDLDAYVTIRDPGRDARRSVAEVPYSKLELFWPLELLDNGVELIDSPGLNEHEVRARITAEYLNHVDAVLFVLGAQALAGRSELEVIDGKVRKCGHEDLFFLVNRFDQVPPAERDALRDYGLGRLEPRTARGADGVFFLSGLEALQARQNDDPEAFEASGFAAMERALGRFLTRDRGPIKLLQPARRLDGLIEEVRLETLPDQRRLLQESLEEIEARYREAQPLLERAERRLRTILGQIDKCLDDFRGDVQHAAGTFLRQVAGAVVTWAEEVETEGTVKMATLKPKQQLDDLAAEVVQALRERLAGEFQVWSEETLEPLVERHLQALDEEIRSSLEDFRLTTAEAREVILGSMHVELESEDPGAKKRMLAGALGAVISPWGAAHGVRFGFEGLGASAGAQLAAAFLAGILGLSLPVAAAALLVTGLITGRHVSAKLTAKVKRRVGEGFQGKLNEHQLELVAAVADDARQQLAPVRDEVEEQLSGELAAARETVESVLQEKRAGEEQVQERRRTLDRLDSELADLERTVRRLTYDVLGVPAGSEPDGTEAGGDAA